MMMRVWRNWRLRTMSPRMVLWCVCIREKSGLLAPHDTRRPCAGRQSGAGDVRDAHRKIAQFRGEGSFAGWLYRIAYTRHLMEARRRELEALDCSGGEAALIAKLDLEKAMSRLSAQERAALTLCYAQGFSNDEAALILNLERSARHITVTTA